jgi:hypothetical protein
MFALKEATMATNARLPILFAAVLLLVAFGAAASDAPSQCTTSGGGWVVNVSDPFEPASCPVARCTGLTYTLTPLRGEIPDHVAVLVEHDAPIVIPPSTFDTPPCAGDVVTALGFRDCSSQTARINQNQQKVGPFDLVVQGVKKPEGGSIVVKKGKVVEQCRIATLGVPFDVFDPHEQISVSETIQFKACTLTIAKDPITGEPGVGALSGNCKFVANGAPLDSLSLAIGDTEIGHANWASINASLSSGSDSCTTRTISGRLYSFCDCTGTTDPRPPCS